MHVRDLIRAIRSHDAEGVRSLVRRGASVDALDRHGRTLVMRAVIAGDPEVVRALLDGRADLDARDPEGWTALHYAAQEGRAAIAELLLARGARVDAPDAFGNTPLWRAGFAPGGGEVAARLRRAGANPWLPNRSGVTPIDLARSRPGTALSRVFPEAASPFSGGPH